MIYSDSIKRQGGPWLGAVREHIQRSKINGSRVTWGSDDVLNPPVTIREIEEIGAVAVASVVNKPDQIDKPKPTELQNHIILYSKGWYGNSKNILEDLKVIIGTYLNTDPDRVSKKLVMESVIDVFETYVCEFDKKEALRSFICWDKEDMFYVSPIDAMLGKISLINGRKYMELNKRLNIANFGDAELKF